jgi:hypothetical protein
MPATKATPPASSTHRPGPSPREDKQRDVQQVMIEDSDNAEARDRDLEHGEGGTLGLPSKPGDLSQDD